MAAGRSYSGVRNAVRRGALPARREAGRWWVAPADLAAWRRPPPPVAGPIDPAALYRRADAARLSGVTRQAVHQALAVGRLPAVATPKGRRVRGADVLAYWPPNREGTS
jgi:hypothetical protein